MAKASTFPKTHLPAQYASPAAKSRRQRRCGDPASGGAATALSDFCFAIA